MSEWDNFAFTEEDYKPHPCHRQLEDLRAAILGELTKAGQVEPWNIYFYLVRETGPVPQEIRNYLAALAVGQKKYKKPSGRKSVDAEFRRLISKMVRATYVDIKATYVSQGEIKTDAKERAIEYLAQEHKVSESFIEKLVNPRNKK